MNAKNFHQYIERSTGHIRTETLFGDRIINFLFSGYNENPYKMFNLLTSGRVSKMMGFLNFNSPLNRNTINRFNATIDFTECVDAPEQLNTAQKIFERKIRYWENRPMADNPSAIVSPADAKILVGSFRETSRLYLKDKFFDFEELIGKSTSWASPFQDGDYAVFRLTPEKYHYNHTPVAGIVRDIYEIPGRYHPCNPSAVVSVVTPYSKNKRVVTVIDTDVDDGSRIGLVAMIEVVALMIGDIVQCYSETRYDAPRDISPGMFLHKGCPKSLYRPGSSTDLLIFQKGKITFCDDIVRNMYNVNARSRFSSGFGRPLVETDIAVRSDVGFGIPTNIPGST